MLPYWLLFVILVGYCLAIAAPSPASPVWRRREVRRGPLWTIVLMLVLFAGLRSQQSDGDYINYLDWFNLTASEDQWSGLIVKDPLFQALGLLLRTERGGLALLMLVSAFATLAIKVRLLDTPDYRALMGLSLLFLVSRFFLLHEFTQVRAALGIAMGSLGVAMALQRRGPAAALWLLLASLTHLSTVLLAPLALYAYPLVFWKKAAVIGTGAVAIAVALPAMFGNPEIAARLLPYYSGEYEVSENSLLSVYFITKVGVVALMVLRWRTLNPGLRTAALASGIGAITTMVFLDNDVISLRLSELSSIFDCICFAYVFRFGVAGPRVVRFGLAAGLALIFFASSTKIVSDYALVFM